MSSNVYVNNVTITGMGAWCVKPTYCHTCRKQLVTDEVALSQRLLGMQIGSFYCIDCLAVKLKVTVPRLQELTQRFKEMGCAYFTRLMEVASDEKEHDGM